ncbi:MAG: carbohydrate porin [Candidatus Accumulibacter sp.]|uniref:carbohydrate porin n=1 Tax=Accumulibacter sp. TaxID=2053492 RepID=UPI00287A9C2C|nr:carbohydrate porin [Accumulibacter sp.]MDS4015407.1 carbohydrate porin [Accumulibacter sp.]
MNANKTKQTKGKLGPIACLVYTLLSLPLSGPATAEAGRLTSTSAAAGEASAAPGSEPAAADDEPTDRLRHLEMADTPTEWRETTLTGDWQGRRQRLSDAGIKIDLSYTGDLLRNTRGGLRRGSAYLGHVDLVLRLDGEKLVGWPGGAAYLQLIGNSGGPFNGPYAGSLMGSDNIEAPRNRTGVFRAWLQQSFLDDRASLRLGLYPVDTEFYVTDASGIFLHPSFGMAAEAGDFGTRAGPPMYATSSYGARLRFEPDPAWYAMLALAQAVPSERIGKVGPHITWQQGAGSLLIAELGFSPTKAGLLADQPTVPTEKSDDFAPISKLAVGAWRFNPRFAQIAAIGADGEALMARHWGAYLLAEQTLYRVPGENRDVAVFFRYGIADGRTNNLDSSLSFGLSLRGPFAGRDNDTFGIAVTRAHAGAQGRHGLAESLGSSLAAEAESVLEIAYRAQVMPGVVLQPLFQRILNPGLSLPHASIVGVRLQLAF